MKRAIESRMHWIRWSAVGLLLFGTLASTVSPAAAQADPGVVSDTEYESPQFDFALEWTDPWAYTADSAQSEDGKLDIVELSTDGAYVRFFLLFPTDDPSAYLDVWLTDAQDSGVDYEEIATETDSDYLSATVEYTFEGSQSDVRIREYIEVRDVDARTGNDAGLFTAGFYSVADDFEANWQTFNDSVARDGRDIVFLGLPAGIDGSGESGNNGNSGGDDDNNSNSGNQTDGASYTSPDYGYYVAWDDSIWESIESEDVDPASMLWLSSDNSQLQFSVYEEPGDTARDCLNTAAKEASNTAGVSNFSRSNDYDPPASIDEADGRVYEYTFASDAGDLAVVQYIECRPIENDAYVHIDFLAIASTYEAAIPEYEDVMATFDASGGGSSGNDDNNSSGNDDDSNSSGDDDGGNGLPDIGGGLGQQGDDDNQDDNSNGTKKTPGLDGNTYTGDAYDYVVTWDADVWEPTELDPADGYEGLRIASEASTGFVEVFEGYDGDAVACLEGTGDSLADIDGVSGVRKSTRLDAPKTARDAEGAVYTYTYTSSSGDEIDFVEYIECRELVPGSVVFRFRVFTVADQYESELASYEDVIASFELGNGGGSNNNDPEPEPTEESGNNGSGGDFEGVEGRVYTSPLYGFTLTWDREWEVLSTTSSNNNDTLTISNGTSTALLLAGAFSNDPAACVEDLSSVAGGQDGVTNYQIVTNEDGEAQTGGGADSAWALYSLTRGGDDYFNYLYCQPASSGDYVVAIIFEMPVAEFATELDGIDGILNGLEID